MHFIGVGGVGLSGLARLYATRGIPTTGSELHDWPVLPELERLGVTIYRRHEAANLEGVDTVVRSTAHPDDHIELAEARRRGLRIFHRSEALAAAMTGKATIAVAGTHGKTTTTAMVTEMLAFCGLDPSFVNGGESAADGRSGAYGNGDYFVAEADESDSSFLRYRPEVAILTNVDQDHLNNYGSFEGLKDGFADFLRGTTATGAVVVCDDDPDAAEIGDRLAAEGRRVLRYGTGERADLRITPPEPDGDVVTYRATYAGKDLGEFRIPVPGVHLAMNSAAAVLAALYLGVDPVGIRDGLAAFPGVRRRFQLTGTVNGIRIYDEYAYHPTAMTAAIETLKGVAGEGRLLVVFQPLRVYRTNALRTEIAAALALADHVFVMEIFGPGEVIPPGQDGAALCQAIQIDEDRKSFLAEWNEVPPAVHAVARPGDVVVTMGAPPVSLMPADILTALTYHD